MGPGLNTILTVPVFAVLYAYTAVGIIVVIFLSWLKAKSVVQFLCMMWARSVFLLMGKKLVIEGKENIRKDEKYIIVSNHASLFDIVAITSFFPKVSWFGHERLLKIPLFSKFLKLTDYVPFREPTVKNTRNMIEQLTERAGKQSVALFPEGTRTLNGKISPFYRGFIYLFRTKGLPILPVTLNGFYELKPKTRHYINFSSKLGVVIHKPLLKEDLADKSDVDIINTIREIIESAYN